MNTDNVMLSVIWYVLIDKFKNLSYIKYCVLGIVIILFKEISLTLRLSDHI